MLRDCESFRFSGNASDYWAYNRYYPPSGYNSISITTGGGTNDPCLYFGNNGVGVANICRRIVPGGPFSALGHSLRMLVGIGGVFSINAVDLVNGVNHCGVNFNGTSGVIQVYGPGGVLLTTAPGQFPINAYFWVEVLFTIGSGTSGSVKISLPSTTINLTGVNTQNGSRALADTTSYTASNNYNFVQHKVWWDTTGTRNNNFLGDRRVIGVLPTANGDTTQLTPVGLSTNYANAGQSAPNGANYNAGSTVGNGDLYKGASPSGVTAVAGVMVSLLGEKDDSGTRSAATWLKSGGTLASGATVPLASSYTTQSDIWETDPSTGVPFTPAALSAPLQFGGKVAA
jgi:hypothetical protein